MRRSGSGRPKAVIIGRLIHGLASALAGQVPSFSPARTTTSAEISRASSGPRIESRGWRP